MIPPSYQTNPRDREGGGLTHVSLFSGIGGIDLAAHWAGFETVAFVERDDYCQKVLAKHWPGVPIYDDVSTFQAEPFAGVDLVSGGFPCQDVSCAGKQAGIEGERSGLFRQLLRIVRVVRPKFALLENVSGLITGGGIGSVLGELAALGFDAIWGSPQASSVGALHQRERVFIVAYPPSVGSIALESEIANAYQNGRFYSQATARWHLSELSTPTRGFGGIRPMPPPEFIRMVDGAPAELDCIRLKALGNAVVPQQVYPILKAIAEQLQGVSA